MARETALVAPYGGQALIEGVMIRGPLGTTMAVRRPDGEIVLRSETADSPRQSFRTAPFLRGIFTLHDTLRVGIRSLHWSARVAAGREDAQLSPVEKVTSILAIGAAAAAFIAGPVLLTAWVSNATGSVWLETISEGVLRIGILLGYIWFVGRLPEIQRVFQYHGAEHRAVHAHEHDKVLTVANLRSFPNAHPRCGTAFLLTVGVVSMALFVALGSPPLWVRLVERVLLTPIVASLAYEFLRASQSHEDSPIMRALARPNLWLQRMTTRDPDDAQMEVAIAALSEAISFGELVAQPLAVAVARAAIPVEADEE
jgi:uncharacterized protein YqhQ